jgi:hypothetical protein
MDIFSLTILTVMIISTSLYAIDNIKNSLAIFCIITTMIIVSYIDGEACKITSYINYRDKSYKDYSKDKEYLKWLVDNPKENVNGE